ncbi:MAG: hypothetical protein U0271_31540 [Polyangiaceae bacterium]
MLFSGGEPALVPGVYEAARSLRAAGVVVELYTSGFSLDERRADEAVDSFHVVHVSLDSADALLNDHIRGREGAHEAAITALDRLDARATARRAAGVALPKIGIECTLVGANNPGLEELVEYAARRWRSLDLLRQRRDPSGRGSSRDVTPILVARDELASLRGARPEALARDFGTSCST